MAGSKRREPAKPSKPREEQQHTWGDPAFGEDPTICTSCNADISWPIAQGPCADAAMRTGKLLSVGARFLSYTVKSVRRGYCTRLYMAECSGCGGSGEIFGYHVSAHLKGIRPPWCRCPRGPAKKWEEELGGDGVGDVESGDLADDADVTAGAAGTRD